VVAIQRKDTGSWALPGGMVDAGEAVSETVRREFTEEAGAVSSRADKEVHIYLALATSNSILVSLTMYLTVSETVRREFTEDAGAVSSRADKEVDTHTHTHTHTYIYIYIFVYIYIYIYIYICSHSYTYTYLCIHVCLLQDG